MAQPEKDCDHNNSTGVYVAEAAHIEVWLAFEARLTVVCMTRSLTLSF